MDFKQKILNINNKIIKLKIWDIAWSERFRAINNSYFKGKQGIIIAYDISDKKSFENVRDYIKQIEIKASKNVKRVFIGTKYDLSYRIISEEEGKKLADVFGLKFFETYININEVFSFLQRIF